MKSTRFWLTLGGILSSIPIVFSSQWWIMMNAQSANDAARLTERMALPAGRSLWRNENTGVSPAREAPGQQ